MPIHLGCARDVTQLCLIGADVAGQSFLGVGDLQGGARIGGGTHHALALVGARHIHIEEEHPEDEVVDRHVLASPDEGGAPRPVDVHEIGDVEERGALAEREDVVGPDRQAR